MKIKIKKVICFLLAISLLLNLSYMNANAADKKTINKDGYSINVVSNNNDETVVSTNVDGVTYTLSLDKEEGDFTLVKEEYPANIFGVGIGIPEESEYNVNIEDTTDDCVVAEAVNVEDTSDSISIDETEVVAQAELVIAGGLGYILTVLIEALLALAATVIVAGVVYYAAKSVAKTLKRKQPKIHYYMAYLSYGDNVYIGPKLKSKSVAAKYLASGGNVFAVSSGYAYDACKSASPIKTVSSKQKHAGEGKNYYHYHPMLTKKKQSHAHCWFL